MEAYTNKQEKIMNTSLENEMKYALQDAKGLYATNDTRTGPQLTAAPALAYVWKKKEDAESVCAGFSSAVGAVLKVVEIH